jgi:dinuclear metal center YbgI/SA1388 family protein
MTISRDHLLNTLDALLQPYLFEDYCPNGLQVEGKSSVKKLVTGVTASQALIEEAIAWQADAILVHHGYFWKNENPAIVGMKQRRLKKLLKYDINLFAYHLPLDAHAELGNNIQLAKQLNINVTNSFADIGLVGKLESPLSAEKFAQFIAKKLQREPLFIVGGDHIINTIAWCTGAAQSFIEKVLPLDVDAFLTGEVSEPTVHIARENKLHFFAAGHHATERYGVQAVGEHLGRCLDIEHRFIDIDNPA